MTNKEMAVNALIQSSEEIGLVPTLNAVFGKTVKVKIPFTKRACEAPIDDIEFSPRANNSMKRGSVFTIGEIIDIINDDDGLKRIRNLGTKTENEIKTRLLVYAYDRLTDNEKKIFFYDVLEGNCK
jgi:DNA-directed RNA polymerase alpha subunit